MNKILVLAYAISPTRGSEYGVGWNYILSISKYFEVDVLYGASGDHIGDTEEIDLYLKNNSIKNVNFIKVEPTPLVNKINYLNKIGFWPFFYVAFNFWHRSAYRKAKQLHQINNYALTHQLNPIGYREPGYLYQLGIPHVWGPIGGSNLVDERLLEKKPIKTRIQYKIKNLINKLQLNLSFRVSNAVKRSAVMIYATTEVERHFFNRFKKSGYYLSEQAIERNVDFYNLKNIDENIRPLKLISVGQLCFRKNISFLLRVLSLLKDRICVELHIVGAGSNEEYLKKIAKKLNVDDLIYWHGGLSRKNVLDMMQNSHLHCMSSLSEANTTVVYEAFSVKLPTISLKQNGMIDTLGDGRGFLIDVVDYEDTVSNYANMIINIYNNRSLLESARIEIMKSRHMLTWEYKEEVLKEIYNNILSD